MNRRTFLSALGALPFVGALLRSRSSCEVCGKRSPCVHEDIEFEPASALAEEPVRWLYWNGTDWGPYPCFVDGKITALHSGPPIIEGWMVRKA